jgi:DNA-binding transcriptional MerR regulator
MSTVPLLQPVDGSPAADPAPRPQKSSAAFRTISEVADELDVAQHVLRFWESKFAQIRPLKRGGGRRYYRPEDVELLRQIRSLLYDEGYTIRGVQKLLRTRRTRTSGDEPTPIAPTADQSAAVARVTRPIAPQLRRRLQALRTELVDLKGLLHEVLGEGP